MDLVDQIETMQRQSLQSLIDWAGGQSSLARLLGVTDQVVSNWVTRGRISATMAAEAERQSRGLFSRRNLRPDVLDWRV